MLALAWEELPWDPSPGGPGTAMSRAQRRAIKSTYRAAVPPLIEHLDLRLDPAVVAEAEDARAEITRFDADLSALFADAEFAPLSSVLLRTESASSSQIENITAGARALALAEIGISRYGSNAELVVANVDAMNRALELALDINPGTIKAVHETLTRGPVHANPGNFRTEQVWIGGMAASPHAALFVPPHHHRVEAGIEDLCAFIRRTDMPLVAHAAIAHAQFETIHPFNDGNGRTGRALVHAMLKNGGATTRTTVPVSAGLLSDTEAYFDALTAYRRGDPNPIVTRFSNASFAAVANGRRLAHDLNATLAQWVENLKVRRDAVAWKVLPHLLGHPAITSAIVQEKTGVSQPAADNALRQLRDAGIVSKASGVQRNVVWIADDVISALDEFGVRARRRHG